MLSFDRTTIAPQTIANFGWNVCLVDGWPWTRIDQQTVATMETAFRGLSKTITIGPSSVLPHQAEFDVEAMTWDGRPVERFDMKDMTQFWNTHTQQKLMEEKADSAPDARESNALPPPTSGAMLKDIETRLYNQPQLGGIVPRCQKIEEILDLRPPRPLSLRERIRAMDSAMRLQEAPSHNISSLATTVTDANKRSRHKRNSARKNGGGGARTKQTNRRASTNRREVRDGVTVYLPSDGYYTIPPKTP